MLPKTPSFRLDGKRALITGAGRGLGLAAAAALAEAGAEVWLASRTVAEVEVVARAVRDRGDRATALRLDIRDTAKTTEAIAAHGPFDILVNNAGVARHAGVLDATVADADYALDTNVKAAYFVAQAVARGLVAAQRPGSLIHITSQMAHVGGPNRSLYCASKHAVEGFSKVLAIELGPYGIRSNTLAPTFIRTPLTEPFFVDPKFSGWVLDNIKLGRIGRVEDIMGPVVFLASDASSLMTGSCVMVDGGWTAS